MSLNPLRASLAALRSGGRESGAQERKILARVSKERGSRSRLESRTRAGESPVGESSFSLDPFLEYHGARETLWEAGRTIFQG